MGPLAGTVKKYKIFLKEESGECPICGTVKSIGVKSLFLREGLLLFLCINWLMLFPPSCDTLLQAQNSFSNFIMPNQGILILLV
jgi:hypothetical protein